MRRYANSKARRDEDIEHRKRTRESVYKQDIKEFDKVEKKIGLAAENVAKRRKFAERNETNVWLTDSLKAGDPSFEIPEGFVVAGHAKHADLYVVGCLSMIYQKVSRKCPQSGKIVQTLSNDMWYAGLCGARVVLPEYLRAAPLERTALQSAKYKKACTVAKKGLVLIDGFKRHHKMMAG